MLKKFLCLLLATLAVMMCVTACDNNKPDDEETTPEAYNLFALVHKSL